MASQAIVFDTETTGINGELIQTGMVSFDQNDLFGETTTTGQNYKPSKPIEFGAMAVHHILDSDLVDCPPSSSFQLPEGVEYLIGHNIDFDWNVIGSPAHIKRIDTLAIARKLYPEGSHSLSAMVYQLLDNKEQARQLVKNAHDAKADVDMTLLILKLMLKKNNIEFSNWENLWSYSENARIPTVMAFGKYKGTPIKNLPTDYASWLFRQPDVDPYLKKAISAIL